MRTLFTRVLDRLSSHGDIDAGMTNPGALIMLGMSAVALIGLVVGILVIV